MRKMCHFCQNQGVALIDRGPFKFTVPKRCFGKKVHKIQLDMGPFCEKNDFEHVLAKMARFALFRSEKIDHSQTLTARSGKTVHAMHLVTMNYFYRLYKSFL